MVDRIIPRSALFSLILLLLLLTFGRLSSALKVTSASPCRSVCTSDGAGNTDDDIVCLNDQFTSTPNGTHFQTCVECELGSTKVDSVNGATDVTWGLYNLRYTLSTCIFGVPVEKVSISTPCQVSCSPLQNAISHNLATNSTIEDLSYCNFPAFQDTVGINRCAACYGRMDSQAYMANFLQALHIACLQPPRPSQPFPVAANTIFNSTPIATPTPSSTAIAGPNKPVNLALIISLPIVFGSLAAIGIVACCFFSARHRRRIMAERNRMRAVHDQISPTLAPQSPYYQETPISPGARVPIATPELIHFSPESDHKVNPYTQTHEQPVRPNETSLPQPPHHLTLSPPNQYPYRSYSPADYATHVTPISGLDTSQIGPGPNQQQVHTLHDQYFPPPPPPPSLPPHLASNLPPPPPIRTQEGIEPLRQHQMKTPSLILPVPKKKSMEAKRQVLGIEMAAEKGEDGVGFGDEKDGILLQDYRDGWFGVEKEKGRAVGEGDEEHKGQEGQKGDAVDGKKGDIVAGGTLESPAQVFVYDPVLDRYVKENA